MVMESPLGDGIWYTFPAELAAYDFYSRIGLIQSLL